MVEVLEIQGGANRPLILDRPDAAFRLASGYADLFAVDAGGLRRHLFRVEAGSVLFSASPADGLHLCAVGSLGSLFSPCSRSDLTGLREPAERWASQLTHLLERSRSGWTSQSLTEGELTLPAGTEVSVHAKRTLWARPRSGIVSVSHEPWPADRLLPLTSSATLTAQTDAVLDISDEWPDADAVLESLAFLARQVLLDMSRSAEDTEAAQEERLAIRQTAIDKGLSQGLSDLLGAEDGAAEQLTSPHLTVLAAVMRAAGHELSLPLRRNLASEAMPASFEALLRRAGLYFRPVLLDQAWWQQGGVPMAGHLKDGTPVGLIPSKAGGWLVVTAQGTRAVSRSVASEIATSALQVYPPLEDRPLGLTDMMRFGFRGTGVDIFVTLAFAVLASAVVMAPPIAATLLFDHVVPAGDRFNLLHVVIGLVALAFGQAAFELMRGLSIARVETRLDSAIQAALFHRLLRLPVTFFRSFSAGDLAERVLGLQEARQLITGATLSGTFGLMGVASSSIVLFILDWRLALAGTAVLCLFVLLSALLSFRQLAQERRQTAARGKLQGFVLQLLVGMPKLRSANAEKRGLTEWAWKSVDHRDAFVASRRIGSWQAMVQSLMPWLSLLLIYAAVLSLMKSDLEQTAIRALVTGGPATTSQMREPLTAAAFVGFVTAFGQLTSGLKAAVTAFTSLLTIQPLAERTRPVLQALPDEQAYRPASTPSLQGNIAFRNVSFRYSTQTPLVLNDVNFTIDEGEFVAIAGASGSGKSTLMRLILGFEKAETGEIFYDGIPSHGLDASSLRSQIGIVLQNGTLSAGSIYDNIVGGSTLGLVDAWAAARLVGLAGDIEAMPMGMHTVLNDGAMTISGGQRQRILIARALVRRPRILLFDEATSALDNRTQAIVTETLASLSVTRIVIAHRLSTIREASRILVMHQGSLVESGTYDELMRSGGAFSALARRQLL